MISPEGSNLIELFCVECKAYKDFLWDQMVYKKQGVFSRIWADLGTISSQVDKCPMLIAKKDYTEIIVCLDQKGWELLRRGQKDRFEPAIVCPPFGMYVFLFKELLNGVDASRGLAV